jgi:hypothetical protein
MSDRVRDRVGAPPGLWPRFQLALRDTAAFLLVLVAVGALTAVLGQIPNCLSPDPRPRVVADVAAAEHVLGSKMLLPAYFPDRFRWPPTFRVGRRPVVWVAMETAARDGEGTLAIVQSLEGEPPAPRPAGPLVRRETLRFGADAGELRVYAEPGAPLYQLRWRRGERRLLLYGHEEPQTLVRIARTMRSRLVTESR